MPFQALPAQRPVQLRNAWSETKDPLVRSVVVGRRNLTLRNGSRQPFDSLLVKLVTRRCNLGVPLEIGQTPRSRLGDPRPLGARLHEYYE